MTTPKKQTNKQNNNTNNQKTALLQRLVLSSSIHLKKTLIIPQGAILLWSWRARKIIIHKVKRTIQQTQHHQQKSLTLTIVIVINIEQL